MAQTRGDEDGRGSREVEQLEFGGCGGVGSLGGIEGEFRLLLLRGCRDTDCERWIRAIKGGGGERREGECAQAINLQLPFTVR